MTVIGILLGEWKRGVLAAAFVGRGYPERLVLVLGFSGTALNTNPGSSSACAWVLLILLRPCNRARSTFSVHRSPFTVRRSPFAVHRSPFAGAMAQSGHR